MGLDALNWYEVAQNRPWAVSDHFIWGVPRGPSVVTGSFMCGCGRTFGRSSDLTRHKKYCNDQPPPPKQSEFCCGCGRLFRRMGDFTRHRHYWVVSLIQVFGSRTLLLSSNRPLKVKDVWVCACMCVCVRVSVRACVCGGSKEGRRGRGQYFQDYFSRRLHMVTPGQCLFTVV